MLLQTSFQTVRLIVLLTILMLERRKKAQREEVDETENEAYVVIAVTNSRSGYSRIPETCCRSCSTCATSLLQDRTSSYEADSCDQPLQDMGMCLRSTAKDLDGNQNESAACDRH